MSDERDFGQRVMAAAGVAPSEKVCACGHVVGWHVYDGGALGGHGEIGPCNVCECQKWTGQPVYPDPLTPEGFVALWDALEARGLKVWFTEYNWCNIDGIGVRAGLLYGSSTIPEVPPNRAAALLEAAAQALGVSR